MTSGSLPLAQYHRADQLGAGTFGSVVTVYNDDGEKYALKLFFPEEEDETPQPLDVGALREISCLRLLRGKNGHPNIVPMHDVQSEWTDEAEAGAGTAGCLGMALPLYQMGTLEAAVHRGMFQGYPRRVKVEMAHGLLSAVSFLHDNGILHRDIKADNVLLQSASDGTLRPVLIDFSLAKPMNDTIYTGQACEPSELSEEVQHTGEVGTVTYTAPEVVQKLAYSKPMDVWSLGVILLELLQNRCLASTKSKEAFVEIEESLNDLPVSQPFPELVRGMLKHEPNLRFSCRQALGHELFCKFGMSEPENRNIRVAECVPYDERSDGNLENDSPNLVSNKSRPKKQDRKMSRRIETIEKLCKHLGSENKMTCEAALEYSVQLEQLDDCIDNLKESQGLLDCVVLAYRFLEVNVLDLHELEEADTGYFERWSLDEYIDNESSLFMLLDYCLYPRRAYLKC